MTLLRYQTLTKSIKFSLVICELILRNNGLMLCFLLFSQRYAFYSLLTSLIAPIKGLPQELYPTTIFIMVYVIKLRFKTILFSVNKVKGHRTNNQLKPLPKQTFVNHRGGPMSIHIASYRLSVISKKKPHLQDFRFSQNLPTSTSIVKTITSNVEDVYVLVFFTN